MIFYLFQDDYKYIQIYIYICWILLVHVLTLETSAAILWQSQLVFLTVPLRQHHPHQTDARRLEAEFRSTVPTA